MNIRKGDNVVMLSGKDRTKTGKILLVHRSLGEGGSVKVVVEGLNMIKKHQRARKQGQKGQIVSKERAVDQSNVQIVCPKCGKPTRVGHQLIGNPDSKVGAGKKIRICKKCKAEF
jgi:large subunit ribosomal protein L24